MFYIKTTIILIGGVQNMCV